MDIELTINGEDKTLTVRPGELLLHALRRAGCYGVKHGCETGECGACAVIWGPPGKGRLVNTCTMLAAQADGATITTIEGLAPAQAGPSLDPIQQAFITTGAIQCGYCTPAQILAAKVLLETEPKPTEAEVREALAGVLCRCTGYIRPVEAGLQAAGAPAGEEAGRAASGESGLPAPPARCPPA